MEMSDNSEDIIDKMIDMTTELNNYLDDHMRKAMKEIITTCFEMHGHTKDLFRIIHIVNTVVDNYVINFITLHQDSIIGAMKEHNLIIDYTDIAVEREKLR